MIINRTRLKLGLKLANDEIITLLNLESVRIKSNADFLSRFQSVVIGITKIGVADRTIWCTTKVGV